MCCRLKSFSVRAQCSPVYLGMLCGWGKIGRPEENPRSEAPHWSSMLSFDICVNHIHFFTYKMLSIITKLSMTMILLRLKSFVARLKSPDPQNEMEWIEWGEPGPSTGGSANNHVMNDGSSSVRPLPDWLQMCQWGPAALGSRGCAERQKACHLDSSPRPWSAQWHRPDITE